MVTILEEAAPRWIAARVVHRFHNSAAIRRWSAVKNRARENGHGNGHSNCHGDGSKNKLSVPVYWSKGGNPTATKNGKEDDLDGTAPTKHDVST